MLAGRRKVSARPLPAEAPVAVARPDSVRGGRAGPIRSTRLVSPALKAQIIFWTRRW